MLRQLDPCGLLAFADHVNAAYTAAIATFCVLVAIVVLSSLLLVLKQYKRCPPNRLLVIFGRTKTGVPEVIHGGAVFVVPFLQDYAYLSLDPIDVELSLSSQSGAESLGFAVPRKFTVAIGTEPPLAETAAARLLGLTVTDIRGQAEEIIGSALGRTIEAATESPIDRDAFYTKLEAEIGSGLTPLGLQLVSLKRA